MKSLPGPDRLALLLVLTAATALGGTLMPTEWQYRQGLTVATRGLVRVELSADSFDSAGPTQQDFRIIDDHGREIASLLDDPPVPVAHTIPPAAFDVRLESGTTIITLTTGTKEPLAAVTLETPQPFFLRAARVEISEDGSNWFALDEGLPLFRQWGAEKLTLPLRHHVATSVRIVVTENRGADVPFTGARLSLAAAPTPALMPVGVRLNGREEFAGETVLTLALDGRHLPLAALTLNTKEPLFMRRVTVTIHEMRDAVSAERTLAAGTLYRVALGDSPARAQLTLPLNFTAPTSELFVHIYNGDSPPLVIDGVGLQRWPVNLLFMAPAAGRYYLLAGNPSAPAPHYDLAGFAGELRAIGGTGVIPDELEQMPHYHPRESLAAPPLPEVPLTGSPLKASDWTDRRRLLMQRPGVQELELDLEALARARPDFGDFRVLHAGNQIPYVLELPGLARAVDLAPVATPDPRRRSVSVWQLQLPHAGAPLRRIVLNSATPLFSRDFRLYEKLSTAEGRAYENVLAAGTWSRTPEPGVPETHSFELSDRLRTDTLWIETDNGDNPAIALGTVSAIYPVVRLVYKVAATDGYNLVYGNRSVGAPRYDLRLVAEKLLTASRSTAKLAASDPNSTRPNPFANLNSGFIFWGALVLVVIVLLVVVVKLLPKPPLI